MEKTVLIQTRGKMEKTGYIQTQGEKQILINVAEDLYKALIAMITEYEAEKEVLPAFYQSKAALEKANISFPEIFK